MQPCRQQSLAAHREHGMGFEQWLIGAVEALVVIETLFVLIVVIRRQAERIAFSAELAGGRVDPPDPRVRRVEQGAIAIGFIIGGAIAYLLLEHRTPATKLELAAIIALSVLPLLLAQLAALWWTHDVGDEVYGDD
jgi:archaellum biogenesis protein FlaJ (TadC family)